MVRALAAGAIALALALALIGAGLWALRSGALGRHQGAGTVTAEPRAPQLQQERRAAQRRAARAAGVREPRQILFGDLHVHTTFSPDAFFASLPLVQGEGAHPPADACDFARHCSALDFWSINDHAFGITQRHWEETVDSIRQCNAVAGDPADPDVVAFLGWEWTQMGFTPEEHYGHKNVVLRDLDPETVPARPIGALGMATETPLGGNAGPILAAALRSLDRAYLDAATYAAELRDRARCPAGVPVRALPPDCQELVATPGELFAKLDEWGAEALVIPHGTTWGYYTPPGSSWEKQLDPSQHDPERQRLIEVYSGHGNAEEYRPWRAAVRDAQGRWVCPEPSAGYLPACWRAGEIVRSRCEAAGEPDCEARAVEARHHYVEAGIQGWKTVPGTPLEEWLDAGQCADCFLPAFNHRPGGSVQSILARTSFADPERPLRFRMGLIASSDNHTARPGTGYKERDRREMTDVGGLGAGGGERGAPSARSRAVEHARDRATPFLERVERERAASFFLTGGLVAAHARGRSREAVWDALLRGEVYGTSGPRILLWFELLDPADAENPDAALPMGSAATASQNPVFRVRAVGSFEQLPGCPESSAQALGPERLHHLCRGECYHPSDRRRLVNRIEVVRIRPQAAPDEPLEGLIEDPWRVLSCEPHPAGCSVQFTDADFVRAGRDALYYVRAIEEPSPAVNARNLRCTYDEEGRCIRLRPCADVPYEEDCLAPAEERAWSSPIWVEFAPRPAVGDPAAPAPLLRPQDLG